MLIPIAFLVLCLFCLLAMGFENGDRRFFAQAALAFVFAVLATVSWLVPR